MLSFALYVGAKLAGETDQKLGPKKRVHKDWVTTDSLEKIKKRREIKEQINASRSEEEKRIAKENYSIARRDVKSSLKKDKNAYIEELAESEQNKNTFFNSD